jgi:hypothetical protein
LSNGKKPAAASENPIERGRVGTLAVVIDFSYLWRPLLLVGRLPHGPQE